MVRPTFCIDTHVGKTVLPNKSRVFQEEVGFPRMQEYPPHLAGICHFSCRFNRELSCSCKKQNIVSHTVPHYPTFSKNRRYSTFHLFLTLPLPSCLSTWLVNLAFSAHQVLLGNCVYHIQCNTNNDAENNDDHWQP